MGDSGDWKMIADAMAEVDLGAIRVNSEHASSVEIELTPIVPKTKKTKHNFRRCRFRLSLRTIPEEEDENSLK
tara:strand:- start:1429 stop:1647 length:219 start_codon:yes stop_codon:yes gene_type:complete